jgi:hypothetical protein
VEHIIKSLTPVALLVAAAVVFALGTDVSVTNETEALTSRSGQLTAPPAPCSRW